MDAYSDLELLVRDVRGLESSVIDLESRYTDLGERADEAERAVREVAGRAGILQQQASDAEEAINKADGELAELRRMVIKLAGRVNLLEHHVRAGDRAEPADLDNVPGARDLARSLKEADRARATLLDDDQRRKVSAEIAGYERLRTLQQEHLDRALRHSKVIAETGPADPARREAVTGLADARKQHRTLTAQVRQQQSTCDAARAELAADDQRRADLGPVIMDGERARATLRGRARASVSSAVERRAVPPVWFTVFVGHDPPADGCDAWLDAAADLVAYRVTYGVTDAVNALGPQVRQADDPARHQWRTDLERTLQEVRLLT